jgi:GNAT superfamily N-acetyltransferase
VLPRAQGAGVGSALLTALLGAVPDGGRVRLKYVDGNERAAAFYAAKRFADLRREPGERPGWPESVWMGYSSEGSHTALARSG